MGRPLRVIQNIYPYHLICRTNNRTFRFNQRQVTRIFFKALRETIEKYGLLVHHVVLMSNHYHIIATATEENLHRAMQYLNSRVAVRYNKHVRRSGHLWGDRYKSCIIDTDEYYTSCVRYVYRNPLRAGIVKELQEFGDSSFQYYAFGRKIDVFLADDHLVMRYGKTRRELNSYIEVLVLGDDGPVMSDEEMKKGLSKPFFGSSGFIEQMYKAYFPC
jgi:putative transposase